MVIVPERLKERIAASGLSKSAISREVGFKQPTLTRLANGEQRTTTRLLKLARTLKTTPAYLEGETDDPDSNEPSAVELSVEEAEHLDLLRGLEPEDRRAIVRLARSLASSARSPTVHGKGQEFRGQGRR